MGPIAIIIRYSVTRKWVDNFLRCSDNSNVELYTVHCTVCIGMKNFKRRAYTVFVLGWVGFSVFGWLCVQVLRSRYILTRAG